MFSPRSLLVIVFALMVGGIAGRVTAPENGRSMETLPLEKKSREGSSTSTNLEAAAVLANNDPGTSRAVVDVTPGPEFPNKKPIPTLSELLKMTGWSKVWEQAKRFAGTLDENSIRAALQQVDAGPSGYTRSSVQGALLRRWAELNPIAALEYARKARTRTFSQSSLAIVTYAWAENDFQAAMAWVNSLPQGREKQFALSGIINSVADKDPDRALKMLMASPRADGPYSGSSSQVFMVLAQRNPVDAARKAASLPAGQLRSSAFSTIAMQWAAIDPKAAAAWAQTLSGQAQNQTLGSIASQWARNDPKAAADFAQSLESDSARKSMTGDVARTWAQSDAEAAVAWAQSLPNDESRSNAMRQVLWEFVQSEPNRAGAYVLKLRDDPKFPEYLSSMSSQWAWQDPEGAIKWAAKQTDPRVETSFMSHVLGQWAQNEPEKAIAQINLLKDPQAKKQAMENIARQWSDDAPEKAMAWLVSLPAGDDRDSAMRSAVANWTQSKPADVATWLGQLPEGATRDAMISSFSNNVAQNDPEAATAWAFSISDDKKRESAAVVALKKWSQANPSAATHWINQQNFAPEDRAKYLGLVRPKK